MAEVDLANRCLANQDTLNTWLSNENDAKMVLEIIVY